MDLGSLSPGLILGLIVALALAPYVAVMVTAFTKLVVVFSLLRNALGLQQTPPNIVINGLAIILSIYVIWPVGLEMSQIARVEMAKKAEGSLDLPALLAIGDRTKEPLQAFLTRHTSETERAFFYQTAKKLQTADGESSVSATDLLVIIPAFTVSELSRAFQIGFLLFLPFLVIDLIVSNVLQALGMMMLSPTTISLPFKLLLFVVLDGWSTLIHGLVLTY